MSSERCYKWIFDGHRLAAAAATGADDVNVTHADLAEEQFGRPGSSWSALPAGMLWLDQNGIEYESYSDPEDTQVLQVALIEWATSELGHPPERVVERAGWRFD